jgi:hypothetical protein
VPIRIDPSKFTFKTGTTVSSSYLTRNPSWSCVQRDKSMAILIARPDIIALI